VKILHFIYDHIHNPWVGGGGAVRVYDISKKLAGRHHITIVCGKYPGAQNYIEGNLKFDFVGTHKNNYILSTFCYAFEAAKFLRKYGKDHDIVIEDFAPYNPLFSRFITKAPLILQVHHKEGINLIKRYFILGVSFMIIEKFYPRLFKNIICVSEASRDKFSLSKAEIIPNGIDNGLFVTDFLGNKHFEEKEYISYLGRLHIHNKGLDTLIKAMKKINIKLAIGGEGRDKIKLASLIEKSGLWNKVELKGFLTDNEKKNFLGSSKIFVLPSRYEGQGIALLEAAACGKPVIVSNIPELKYAVDAGFGISFKIGNATDLAEKIKFLWESDTLRQEMGQRAREYAKKYTWDKIAEGYEKFLIKITRGI
jgi:glycosyltransferase involved in cell wall biosynthesis